MAQGYAALRIGVVDKYRAYRDVAFGIISQDENEERAKQFLEIVDDHIKHKLGHPEGLNIKCANAGRVHCFAESSIIILHMERV